MGIQCWAQHLVHWLLRQLTACAIAACCVQLPIHRKSMHKVPYDVNVRELGSINDASHVGQVIPAHYVPHSRLERGYDPLVERPQCLLTLKQQC